MMSYILQPFYMAGVNTRKEPLILTGEQYECASEVV
jgi:hypothetical protein